MANCQHSVKYLFKRTNTCLLVPNQSAVVSRWQNNTHLAKRTRFSFTLGELVNHDPFLTLAQDRRKIPGAVQQWWPGKTAKHKRKSNCPSQKILFLQLSAFKHHLEKIQDSFWCASPRLFANSKLAATLCTTRPKRQICSSYKIQLAFVYQMSFCY